MSLRYLTCIRRLSTSSVLKKSYLSTNYKSRDLWDERFKCKLIGSDDEMIKSVNNKIVAGEELNNLELDIFVNIAVPSKKETAQLQECAKLLSAFRKTIYSHTLIPTTSHALCRLFLYSLRMDSLILILEDRVKYGVFPDFFIQNLMTDDSLDKENYALAARLAIQVMLQEEFGVNPITDSLSLLSVLKYIETKTDFSDLQNDIQNDCILNPKQDSIGMSNKEDDQKNKHEEQEDEEEDQYVRIPFLRNPYFDNHFDVTNPRVQCGRTLCMLAEIIQSKDDASFAHQINLIGWTLQGKWDKTRELLKDSENVIDKNVKSLARFYVENLHGLDEVPEDLKNDLLSILGEPIESEEQVLSRIAESRCSGFEEQEKFDIQELRTMLQESSNQRESILRRKLHKEEKARLLQLIEQKKKELADKEEYLYFYDRLKKSRITRIEYN